MVAQLISAAKADHSDLAVVETTCVQVLDQIQAWQAVLQQSSGGEEVRTAQGLFSELAAAATALRAAAHRSHAEEIDLETARLEDVMARAKRLAAGTPTTGTGLVGALALAVDGVQNARMSLPQYEAVLQAALTRIAGLQAAYGDPLVAALPHVREFREALAGLAGGLDLMGQFAADRDSRLLREGFDAAVAADSRLAELAAGVQEALADLSRNGLGMA